MGGAVRISNFSTRTVSIDPSCAAAAFTAKDLVADTEVIDVRSRDREGWKTRLEIRMVTVLDKDDQGAAMDVYFLKDDVTMGTEGSVVAPSDTNAENIIDIVQLTTWHDLSTSQFATSGAIAIPCVLDKNDLYIAIVTKGTPTYTASGLHVVVTYSLEN